jgi:NAD(P)-dependent dehydrogenase (short-subunit alcohol dehydrogenase family)
MTTNIFDLTGQTALITGGSRGLGLQMAEVLADNGATVILTARKAAELEAAVAHIVARGGKAEGLVGDMSNLDGMPAFAEKALEVAGNGVSILVNNAGATWGAPAEDYPLEAWNKVMNLNITSIFLLTREIGKRSMIPANYGRILNIASVAGLGGNRADLDMKTIAYNTSKGAVINFTKALAVEWGRYGISVNALCPGFFPTKMAKGLMDHMGDRLLPAVPNGRFGNSEDLKAPALMFCSKAAGHISGQWLAVDGGMSASI